MEACQTKKVYGKMALTQLLKYFEWMAITRKSTRRDGKNSLSTLISLGLLRNVATDVFFKEGKVACVPEDLWRFASSMNSCEMLTPRMKRIIVGKLVNSATHWSHRLCDSGEYISWLDFNEQINHRTPEDISIGMCI